MQLTATKAMENIQKAANEACPEVRVCRRIEIGGAIHQGDVYLTRVHDKWPRGKPWGSKQVAIGDTQGSRHVAEGKVKVYQGQQLPKGFMPPKWLEGADPKGIFLGPVIVADKAFTLTHPEHAHHRLPAGCYQVTYQADAQARDRVRD